MTLALTVIQGDLEPPTSFVSRLAARNGCDTAATFCADMGLDIAAIIRGADAEIDRLADLAGADAARLKAHAVRATGRQAFGLGADALTVRSLSRARVRVCPACVLEQAEAHHGLAPRWLPWKLLSLRTCPQHGLPLLDLPGERHTLRGHDFAPQVLRHADLIRDAAAQGQRREASPFEAWLIDRVRHGPAATQWIDGFALHVACRASELLGLLIDQGSEARWGQQTEAMLHISAQTGFDVLRRGPEAFRAALEAFVPRFRGTETSYLRAFGFFYVWIAQSPHDTELAELRRVLRGFILDRFPVAEGVLLLGAPAPQSRYFTIHSARTRMGLGVKRLGNLLVARGLAERDPVTGDAIPHGFIERSVLEGVKKELDGLTFERDAARRLGLCVELFRKLAQQGLIPRRLDPCFRKHQYDLAFLDHFTRTILQDAPVVARVAPGQALLIRAAQRVKADLQLLIGLVRDGHVRCRGVLDGKAGIAGAIIDVAEMKAALPQLEEVGTAQNVLYRDLGVTYATMRYLIDNGFLNVVRRRSPQTRVTVPIIPQVSIDAFLKEYVPVGLLADELGHPAGALTLKLRAAGFVPLAMPAGHSPIFRRKDVAGFAPERGRGSRLKCEGKQKQKPRRGHPAPPPATGAAAYLPLFRSADFLTNRPALYAAAEAGPVAIRRKRHVRFVLMSTDAYEALTVSAVKPSGRKDA